jgi:hypothetical protein
VGFGERVLRRRDLGIATVRKEGDRLISICGVEGQSGK